MMPGTSMEARMLERRVSNNRSDLDGDQKMNYFLSWFTQWSDLQKSDFISVLAEKMSSTVNGGYFDPADQMGSLSLGPGGKRPPSLFDCQIKLFREWFSGWSDDQKNYLIMRLKDIDSGFFSRFEDRMSRGSQTPPEKDFFEPGVPQELVRHSMTDVESVHNTSVHAKLVEVSDEEEEDQKIESGNSSEDEHEKNHIGNLDRIENGPGLETISEDSSHHEDSS